MANIYCGSRKVPKGKKRGSMLECVATGKVSYYGLYAVDPKTVSITKMIKELNFKLEGKINIFKRLNVRAKKLEAEARKEKEKENPSKELIKHINVVGRELVEKIKKYQNEIKEIKSHIKKITFDEQ